MSIYGDFLSDLKISETKRWKADLKNKTLICEGKKYIESSMYDIRHDLIFSLSVLLTSFTWNAMKYVLRLLKICITNINIQFQVKEVRSTDKENIFVH